MGEPSRSLPMDAASEEEGDRRVAAAASWGRRLSLPAPSRWPLPRSLFAPPVPARRAPRFQAGTAAGGDRLAPGRGGRELGQGHAGAGAAARRGRAAVRRAGAASNWDRGAPGQGRPPAL